MNAYKELLHIVDTLLGPAGCPWDREQTLRSTRGGVLEEVCELIEAIDLDQQEHIREELGDVFFNAIFLCRLAEKESYCSLDDVLLHVAEKLIRRHPHVFQEKNEMSASEVIDQWHEIKKKEKGKEHRKSALDDIPKTLPALARAQKSLKKMHKHKYFPEQSNEILPEKNEEAVFGQALLAMVADAQKKGIDAEQALRTALAYHEQEFRQQEASFH